MKSSQRYHEKVRFPARVAMRFIRPSALRTRRRRHLTFAIVTTGYILVALQFEERDLPAMFGEKYAPYRRRVPMFFPRPGNGPSADVRAAAEREASA